MSQDTLKLFQWMIEHLHKVHEYSYDFIQEDEVDDFHSWFIYETNLKKLCNKIDPKISILHGNFTNTLILEKLPDKKLGKLIKELLKQGFLFTISNNTENPIDIDVTYGFEYGDHL